MLAQRGAQPSRDFRKQEPRKAAQISASNIAEPPASKRRMSFKDKHALDTLPKTIAALQAEADALKARLDDPGFYARDRTAFERTTVALAKLQQDIAAAEQQWLELEILREELAGPRTDASVMSLQDLRGPSPVLNGIARTATSDPAMNMPFRTSLGAETPSPIATEVGRRRTFAIISHPDAGKTTLTEKLLLFGGAIQLAGQVKAKRDRRSTRSDWMAIERERGISVVTSVMTFEYGGRVFNLLDTPGHEDFSEDTYRTLTAVNSAVMVIDAAKGIEPRTRKLFEVCRLRDIPIITFINKMDRESRDPFDLIDEIEKTLALDAAPIAWPIGRGRDFVGTIDVKSGGVRLLDGDSGSAGSLREMSLAEIAALNANLDAATLGGELDLVRHGLQAVRSASLCRGPS